MEPQDNMTYRDDQYSAPMSVKDYVIALIIFAIPIVNLIMGFVWGFSNDVNINKKNLSRAFLIYTAIMIALVIIFYIVMFAFVAMFIGAAVSSQGY